MNIRTALLSAVIGISALGAISLPARAEDGRNGAAAIGAIAGIAAGAAASQEGYGSRRAYARYRGEGDWRRRGDGEGDWRRRGDGDDEGGGWRHQRRWCAYHPGRC
jgi:hypothetical protein